MNSGDFEDRMVSRLEADPPVTWSGWWSYPVGKTVSVPRIGPVTKVSEDSGRDDDSYSYYERRTMIFWVDGESSGTRWFKVEKSSSSFDSAWDESDEAWEYPDVSEVAPEQMQVTRWKPVQ